MNLSEMVYSRNSTRSYTGEPVNEATIQKIKEFSTGIKPLYPDIKVRSEVVGRENVKRFLPWTTPQFIAIFSEDQEGALENSGFMFQQVDLYIQSLGLGACWLGMGRLNLQGMVERKRGNGLGFVIMLAFGYPKGEALRRDTKDFKRKALSHISDQQDERLKPARLAPSSVNSQPRYFTHEGDVIHTYCVQQGFLKTKSLSDMSRIDIGIALAQMYVVNSGTSRFFKLDQAKAIKGYHYMGSFTL